jgi:membrane protein
VQQRRNREPGDGAAFRDADLGQVASKPIDIGMRAWQHSLRLVYDNFNQHRIMMVAAGVTFYILLALFPAIAALVSLYGLFADPTTIGQHLTDLSSFMPESAIQVIGDQLNRLTANGASALSATFLVMLAISLWSANSGMKAIFDALNVVYGEREKRGFIKLNALSLAFTICGIGLMLIALSAVVVLPVVLQFIGLSSMTHWIITIGRWPILIMVIVPGIAVVYGCGPSRGKAQWRWISWGSAFAVVAWLLVSLLFSYYTSHFNSYNRTYGSLGAIFGFMTWIWLSVTVILLGAEMDAEIERHARHDALTLMPK